MKLGFAPKALLLWLVLPTVLGCTVGEGSGWVKSDRIYIDGCWNGPFDLDPDFFAANPFRDEALFIRIQHGDNIEELSDGASVVVSDLTEARAHVGEPLQVGLPEGVEVLGADQSSSSFTAPLVSLAVYLHNSCHTQNGTVYSLSGEITFSSLFSGDPNESDASERLTEANFTAMFADPRDLTGDADADAEVTSTVSGYFRFFFQRGQPAQPFAR